MTTHYAGIGEPQTLPLTQLNTYHKNPRRGDVDAIKGSLLVNGNFRPIVVNRGERTGRPWEVLAGNHTLMATRALAEEHPDDPRWHTIDCWVVDVDEERATKIVLADNRTGDLGGYDDEVLAGLLETVDHDLDGTGYDYDDLDQLNDMLEREAETDTDPDDTDATPPDAADTISHPGDVIELGDHRVYCGDSTDTQAVVKNLMHDGLANCVWTDPPYGVEYVGKTKDALTIQNDGAADLPKLLTGAMDTIVTASNPGAPVYVAHADTERINFQTAMEHAGIIVRQNLVWVKNTIALGRSDYHYRHEPILYGFTPGGEGRLGRGGDRWYGDNAQSTVFEYDKPIRNADHPTMKPVGLILHMLQNSCPRRGIVLDTFGGSGSTLLAAEQRGARARLVELDPRYVDVICRRWQETTGGTPTRNGEPLDFTGGR